MGEVTEGVRLKGGRYMRDRGTDAQEGWESVVMGKVNKRGTDPIGTQPEMVSTHTMTGHKGAEGREKADSTHEG